MIVCYALGGGLGHVTRARAVLHTLGARVLAPAFTAAPVVSRAPGEAATPSVAVLASTARALDRRVLGDWFGVAVPPALAAPDAGPPWARRAALGVWVADALARLRPRTIVVDAFPGGLFGELCGERTDYDGRGERRALASGAAAFPWPPGAARIHVARRLRWARYRRRLDGPLPTYDRTFIVEPLEAEHHAALAACSHTVEDLTVTDPEPTVILPPETLAALAGAAGAWLVVHSGPDSEIRELLAYAADLYRSEHGAVAPPRLALVAPRPPATLSPDVVHLDLYPAWPLFAAAPCIVTACGWNLMRQTAPHAAKHHFLPFPRALDDQFHRAACRRRRRMRFPST